MLATMSGAVMLTFWIRSGEELRFFNTKSCSTVAPDRVASKWKRGSVTVAFGPSEANTTAISPMLSKTTPAARIIGCCLELGPPGETYLAASRKGLLRIETELGELQ